MKGLGASMRSAFAQPDSRHVEDALRSAAPNVRLTTLPNGLRVVTERMPHLESAAVGVYVKAGSRDERADQHGMAHLLEHMAFKGTRSRSARDIAEEIENVGGEVNAATSTETTAYYARVLRDDVPLAIEILADILTDSAFDGEELEREQHVIVQEIGAAADTPDDLVFDRFQETAFADQALGRTILGTRESVEGFRAGDIRRYLAENYRASTMVLSAAGAVDHDAVVAQAERLFGQLAGDEARTPEAGTYTGGEMRERKDLQEAHVLLGFGGRAYHARDFYSSQFLAMILGGGMSSRLFQEVREARGLCYAIYAFHWGFSDSGLFGIHAATGEEDIEALMPVVLDELSKLFRRHRRDRGRPRARAGRSGPADERRVARRPRRAAGASVAALRPRDPFDGVDGAALRDHAGAADGSRRPVVHRDDAHDHCAWADRRDDGRRRDRAPAGLARRAQRHRPAAYRRRVEWQGSGFFARRCPNRAPARSRPSGWCCACRCFPITSNGPSCARRRRLSCARGSRNGRRASCRA